MAKKVGICVNIDCDNYRKEVEVEPGSEFECPLCHQPLREKTSGKSSSNGDAGKGKLVALIVAAIVVLGGGYGLYAYLNGEETTAPVVEQPALSAVETPTDTATTVREEPEEEMPAPQPTTPQVLNGRGTVDLGYGIYTGDLKNGKPHGYGTVTYRKEQKIVPSKDFIAKPGDTFEGEFRDGRISGLGYWEHDGNKTAVKP